MIGRLTGLLVEKNPPQITLDVHGVGYEIDVPMSTFYNLPGIGEKVSLHTHLAEDADEDVYCLEVFGRRPVEQFEQCGQIGAVPVAVDVALGEAHAAAHDVARGQSAAAQDQHAVRAALHHARVDREVVVASPVTGPAHLDDVKPATLGPRSGQRTWTAVPR